MSVEGSLEERRLADVLLRLGKRLSTGVVTVQAEREIISIYLLEGAVVAADALNQSLEDGLGEVLTERGMVSPEQYAGLAAEHQAGGGRVTDLLVERRYLSRSQLLDVLRRHAYRLCLQALGWRRGQYKFYAGDEVTYEEGIAPLPIEELLVRAGHDLDASARTGVRPPGPGAVYGLTRDGGAAPGAVESLERLLGSDLAKILELIDGRRTLTEIGVEADCSEYRAAYCLYRLELAGLVRRAAEAETTLVPELDAGETVAEPAVAAPAPRRRRLRWPELRWPARAGGEEPSPWTGRVLGMAAAAALIGRLVLAPPAFLLPFPWQEEMRRVWVEDRLASAHLELRQAAGTFFLLHGRYPDDLSRLVQMGLLDAADVTDPAGRPFRYSATASGYLVRSVEGGEPLGETAMSESITDNFLLDPDYAVGEISDEPPLVLLD